MVIKPNIIIQESKWQAHKDINIKYIRKILKSILKNHFFANFQLIQQIELVTLFTNNKTMQNLNFKYRGINKPTNVLSFPDQELKWQDLFTFQSKTDYIYLGDIAFGYQIIIHEAIEQYKNFTDHFTHLLIHGILHLFGFDHQEQYDAEVMEKLEINILKQFKISSPY